MRRATTRWRRSRRRSQASLPPPLHSQAAICRLSHPVCLCHLSMAAMRRDPFTSFALYAGLLPEQLPHQRALCPLHPFQATARLDAAPVEGNEAACPNCYCLVCDVRVSECRHWQGGDPAHCNAHGNSAEWHQKRVNAKRQRTLAAKGAATAQAPLPCGTPGCSRGAYHAGLCSTETAGGRMRSTDCGRTRAQSQ